MTGSTTGKFRRRILLGIGTLFLILGLGLLGSGVHTLVDRDGKSEAEVLDLGQAEVAEMLGFVTPAPRYAPATPSPLPTVPPPLGDQPYTITIERLGIDAPVRTFGLDENAIPEVPLNATDVAWYDFSARPGTGSNAVFAGHVTWSGRAVFYDLDQLEAGDTVRLLGADGTEIVYTVSLKFSVDPDDPESLKVMHGTDKDVITLITCTGKFTPTDDLIFGGEYSQRLVVRGDLVSITGPSVPQPAGGG